MPLTQHGAVEPSTLLQTLGLDAVGTDGPTGKGVGIAVIDSGLERGTDLNGAEHDKQYVFAGAPRQVAPYDDYGHGTHVSGLIGGSGEGSQGDAEQTGRTGSLIGSRFASTAVSLPRLASSA